MNLTMFLIDFEDPFILRTFLNLIKRNCGKFVSFLSSNPEVDSN